MKKREKTIPEESYFPMKIGKYLIVGAICSVLWGYWPGLTSKLESLKNLDIAEQQWWVVLILLSFTGAICYKQWGYAFVYRSRKGAIFSRTILHFNAIEKAIDWLLAIVGVSGFFVAYYLPSFWLLWLSFYCFLGWLRCRLTLNRKKYAKKWRSGKKKLSENPILDWTYPLQFVEEFELESINVKSATGNEDMVEKMGLSLEAFHFPPEGDHFPITEALGIWYYSFRSSSLVAFIFLIIEVFIWFKWKSTLLLSVYIFAAALIVVCLFILRSRFRANMYIDRVEKLM